MTTATVAFKSLLLKKKNPAQFREYFYSIHKKKQYLFLIPPSPRFLKHIYSRAQALNY